MPRARKKSVIRKKSRSKIFHRKKNRATKKGRGVYENECIFPTPDKNETTGEDSCQLIDLNDEHYGLEELQKLGLTKKECNMYYYSKNNTYYRCRKKNNTTCNKRGASGTRLTKCNAASLKRLKSEDAELEKDLPNLLPEEIVTSQSQISPKQVIYSSMSQPRSGHSSYVEPRPGLSSSMYQPRSGPSSSMSQPRPGPSSSMEPTLLSKASQNNKVGSVKKYNEAAMINVNKQIIKLNEIIKELEEKIVSIKKNPKVTLQAQRQAINSLTQKIKMHEKKLQENKNMKRTLLLQLSTLVKGQKILQKQKALQSLSK